MKEKSAVLVVLDGWGIAPPSAFNAISMAKKKNYDSFLKQYPATTLEAAGVSVGLKPDEPGNSEAGHLNLGAGRVVLQDKVYITRAIHDGSFFKNKVLLAAIDHVKKNKSRMHLMGLLSNGASAHSEPDHLEALLVLAKKHQLKEIYLHLFLDGRDTPPKEALNLIKKLQLTLNNIGVGRIATISGRYYGMDRAGNWDRVGLAYEAMVHGIGPRAQNAYQAVQESYRRGITDEFVLPTVITETDGTYSRNSGVRTIADRDAVIFFNLRSDRARQLTKSFVTPRACKSSVYNNGNFKIFKNLFFVALAGFSHDLPAEIAYPVRPELNTLSQYIGKYPHLRQLYVAELEKYAHVTYFFHGGQAFREPNETRVRVPSVGVATFDLAPAMSANEITQTVVDYLGKQIYNLVVVNYANADMLGHTGSLKHTVKAIEVIDKQLGVLAEFAAKHQAALLVTADHGNAEQMKDTVTGKRSNSHTCNPVPFILVDRKYRKRKLNRGALCDVAPTILEILDLPRPKEMTGKSLLR
ncbi:2,3-bisphosphoglycerate-independent phosphoglycerate mutase [bacterium]|nr:MAG: 2,3-bisphosphoglycerate-independent phosphoglycerate mutase [bacterium]